MSAYAQSIFIYGVNFYDVSMHWYFLSNVGSCYESHVDFDILHPPVIFKLLLTFLLLNYYFIYFLTKFFFQRLKKNLSFQFLK